MPGPSRHWSTRTATWLSCAFVGGLCACGPGIEAAHESNVRFEHCYRLDMDPGVAAGHRYECWRSWTRSYAYGQTRDRMEYARRRIIALESGDTEQIRVHEMPDRPERIFSETGPQQPARRPDTTQASPAPTSAHKPPPATAPSAPPPPPTASTPQVVEDLPGAACTQSCSETYQTCQNDCANDTDACTACREDYRSCMRRCYQ